VEDLNKGKMKKTDTAVIVEQSFNVSAEKVWQAITQVELMRQWFFDNIPDFIAQAGFKTRFNVRNKARDFMHLLEVVEAIPHKKISLKWRYDHYPGDSVVTFELLEKNNGTNLKLTHLILENFPEEIPEFNRQSCLAGWDYFIKENLKRFLQQSNQQ
jgi:uncharacterized protein YndB with AHSA1/START domain